MSVRLVLSGQNTHLRHSGGVGRYSFELYRRILSKSIREYLPDGDILAWDFPDLEEKPVSGSLSGSGIPRKLKNAMKPWIPPALKGPQTRKEQAVVPRVLPFNGKSEPVVFHEVNNYGACSEIARVVLSPSVRYLNYPAKLWKHKNHEFLLRAISARRAEFKRRGLRILLTGGFTKADADALVKEADKHRIKDQVHVLGFQTNEALRALIRNADFLVFPSLFEGFGMPVLEALGSGCPVLCARQTSLPEVAGDAAVFFDAKDIDSLVSVFDQVLAEKIDRKKLIAEGKTQFQKFSWDKNFRETAEQYAKLI